MPAFHTSRRPLPQTGATLRLLYRASRPATITLLSVIILALITLSPLTLTIIARRRGIDWSQLSNIGQSYGAISAILSAFAVVGVTISLLLQSKEALSTRRSSHRPIHSELIRMAMDDPVYMECWGGSFSKQSHDKKRQAFYINLMIAQWAHLWEIGDMPEGTLRTLAVNELFGTIPGRVYWEAIKGEWYPYSNNKKMRRFLTIINESYRTAIVSGPPIAYESTEEAKRETGIGLRQTVGAITLLSMLGGVTYRLIRQKRDRV
jgi:hypothetical protein